MALRLERAANCTFPADSAPQPQPRLVHLRLRRAFRDAEDLGDFAVLEAFDVVQHERGAAPFGQLRERSLEVDRARWPDRRAGGSTRPRAPTHRRGRRSAGSCGRPGCGRSPGSGSSPADTATCRAPTRRESSQLPMRRQENLLQQVLGIGRVAEHPYRQAEQPARRGRGRAPRTRRGRRAGSVRRAPAPPRASVFPPASGAEGRPVGLDVAILGSRCPTVSRSGCRLFVRRDPAAVPEIADSMGPNHQTFGPQQRPFQPLVSAVAAQHPAGGDDPMAGDARGPCSPS